MTNPNDTYTSPLASRNASEAMLRIWSPRHKFNTWRRVWLAVAEAQHEVTKDWGSGLARSVSDGPGGRRPSPSRTSGARPGADASGSLGPLVTREQVEALRAVVERGITDAEIERAGQLERDLRHDVMAHVHCLGESCPEAKGIIHLGCTSQDVVCNADLICQEMAFKLIVRKVDAIRIALGGFGDAHKSIPTLGFTHYQSAQPTTVGRRACGWAQDVTGAIGVFWDRDRQYTRLRGFKGATGTQASFLALFDGDREAVCEFEARAISSLLRALEWEETTVEELISTFARWHEIREPDSKSTSNDEVDVMVEESMSSLDEFIAGYGYEEYVDQATFGLVGQTYPRAHDAWTLTTLAGVAAVLHKIATDIRLLSNRKELDEPFGDKQIGSSAMPYKRNPMKCERICGLSRFVMNLVGNAYDTAATQWLERTLDDSSNRRLSLPEAFLALDGALDLMHEVASGLVVHEAMVRRNLMAELPFLATENILMEAVKAGGDRQDLHERIRIHAQAAGMRVKSEGLDNDLIDRLRADPAFAGVHHLLTEEALLDPMKYIGRAVEQTERFLAEVVEPLRERYKGELDRLGSSDRGV